MGPLAGCEEPECKGCIGADADVDADAELDSEADLDLAEEDMPVRVPVEGTNGFCRTSITIDDSCETAADCVGYRIAPWFDCCCGHGFSEVDCGFASRSSAVEQDECTADQICTRRARACVDGRCVAQRPDRACSEDSDCVLMDTGCECLAISSSDSAFSPDYGQSCDGLTACTGDSRAGCVDGYCVRKGSFLDELVTEHCQLMVSCCEYEMFAGDCSEPDQGVQSCIDGLLADDYLLASKWRIGLESSLLADSCWPMLIGPWVNLLACASSMCPPEEWCH